MQSSVDKIKMPAFRRQSFTVLKSSFHKACHKPNLYEAASIRETKETTTRSWSSGQKRLGLGRTWMTSE